LVDIAISYDRSETDEMGIRLTAEEKGIQLGYLPFHKASLALSNDGYDYYTLGRSYKEAFEEAQVIINRTQSKSRRIFASTLFEGLGKRLLNPLSVEIGCQSKIRTLLSFYSRDIKIPLTAYIPCNVKERSPSRGLVDNNETISALITKRLGSGMIVLKPDAGTHGKKVRLVREEELDESLDDVRVSTINPSGVVAQEFVPKWFYDLRIIVEKEKGGSPYCHPTALARGGLKDFRTNTFLGNMVFRSELPSTVREESCRCGDALGGGEESWLIALDAMPYIGDDVLVEEETLRACFDELEKPFNEVLEAKKDPHKKRNFKSYTEKVEEAYQNYMSKENYIYIQELIEESLQKKRDSILFHEGNACPEFWEQTRIVGNVNVADSLLNCATSLIDK